MSFELQGEKSIEKQCNECYKERLWDIIAYTRK